MKLFARNLPISMKQSIELFSQIRNKSLDKVIDYLKRIQSKKQYVILKRFNKGVGHKPGIGPARFCSKVVFFVFKLINQFTFKEEISLNIDQYIVNGFVQMGSKRKKPFPRAQSRLNYHTKQLVNITIFLTKHV